MRKAESAGRGEMLLRLKAHACRDIDQRKAPFRKHRLHIAQNIGGLCRQWPVREESIRARLENVVTLRTEERVLGAPRCCEVRLRVQAFDRVDLGHADLFDQPSRVRRDDSNSAAAPPRRACRCERRLPRARHAGKSDERAPRDIDIHVLEVVFRRASYAHEAAQALCSFSTGRVFMRCDTRKSAPEPDAATTAASPQVHRCS